MFVTHFYRIVMKSRRQQKLQSMIKEVVSEAILNHLSDPRIKGLVSVTRVEVAADLRNADVYLSSFGKNREAQKATFTAIQGAGNRIRGFLARSMRSRHCPLLRFHMDDEFKKLLETYKIIDEAVDENIQNNTDEMQ